MDPLIRCFLESNPQVGYELGGTSLTLTLGNGYRIFQSVD